MTNFDAFQIQWRKPWLAISSEHAAKAEVELQNKMCAGHVLFGRSIKAMGRRQ